jgi:hypothetical protein
VRCKTSRYGGEKSMVLSGQRRGSAYFLSEVKHRLMSRRRVTVTGSPRLDNSMMCRPAAKALSKHWPFTQIIVLPQFFSHIRTPHEPGCYRSFSHATTPPSSSMSCHGWLRGSACDYSMNMNMHFNDSSDLYARQERTPLADCCTMSAPVGTIVHNLLTLLL